MCSACTVVLLIWYGPEIAHADVLVCDRNQQQKAGPSFSKYGGLKLCRSDSNVPTSGSTELHQLVPETGDGMDWM